MTTRSPTGTGAAGEQTGQNTYMVTVTATDPSGATGMATVNIVVENVDEAPDFGDDDTTELTINEDSSTDGNDQPDEPLGPSGELTYSATDPDAEETAQYSLSGADADSFDIGETSGTLSLKTGEDAPDVDYETQKEYKITIEAKGTADSTAVATLDVTVTVGNVDEDGTVMMTARQPQVGKSVRASVEDPDGDTSGVTWQWASQAANQDGECPDAAVDGGWTDIEMAMSASYTPADADDGNCLQATATYTDPAKPEDDAETADTDESRGDAMGVTEMRVEFKPNANSAPAFPDEEMPEGADPIEMDVEERTEGMILTVTAGVDDGDLLIYTLGGDDAGSFDIVPMGDGEGEISVGKGTTLDYEGKQVYSFMAIATDPSGATDTVDVTITLTDKDEAPVLVTIPPAPAENVAPMFDSESAAFMVDENMAAGAAVGTVEATDEGDTLTYSDDSGYFDVDDSGNITTTMMLDQEAMASHTVTVTATDDEDASDSIMVTITVGDAHPDCTVADNNGLTNDCEALLDSMAVLGGTLDWAAPIADWEGVTVSGDPMRVTRVWLRAKGLNGTIPAALGRLEMLTVLNLHTNTLAGEIPDLSMTSLTALYLQNNQLTGSLPMWLNGMTDMTDLWLWGNQLNGNLPDLSGMTSLNIAKLSANMLEGNIPDGSMLPPNATWLLLQENQLDGPIPDLSDMTSLRVLWLHSNDLTGDAGALGTVTTLTNVNLRGNDLSGIGDLSGLDNLQYLYLQDNELTMIPATLGDLDSLTRLWLHNNELTGMIPSELGNLALTHLTLAGNNFADDACLPGDLASVANNDFDDTTLVACAADDGS